MHYTIDNITALIGARRFGTSPAVIDWLLTDSRSLAFPESTLFFATSCSWSVRSRPCNAWLSATERSSMCPWWA